VRRNKSNIVLICRVHKSIAIAKALLCFACMVLSGATFAQHSISIKFENYAGTELLHVQQTYINGAGEQFTVRNFRYYISNIVLKNKLQSETHEGYFLIDQSDDASKEIILQTNLDSVSAIQFLLGVDSLRNVTGVQTGALDPAMDMYWTWNTGYVMAKLEGSSTGANTPRHIFSYHVGGYKEGEQTTRNIKLSFNTVDFVRPKKIIYISADILKWFDGKNKISIAATPLCHEPGKLAVMLADNYAAMFSMQKE